MASQNPYDYYNDQEAYGSYAYVSLEDIVNNFMQQYTGDDKVLGVVKRSNVIYWAKRGIQELNYDALKEYKAIELELGDALDIVWPPDMVNWVQISWLDQQTGVYRPMAENWKTKLASAWLQDNKAEILFDDNGYVLEGTSAGEIIHKRVTAGQQAPDYRRYCCYGYNGQLWSLDTGVNYNGSYQVDSKKRRIHFGSDCASRIIILVYISDGLEYESESEITINKLAEQALMSWIYSRLIRVRDGISNVDKREAERIANTDLRNAKIRLLNLKPAEFAQTLKAQNRWLR